MIHNIRKDTTNNDIVVNNINNITDDKNEKEKNDQMVHSISENFKVIKPINDNQSKSNHSKMNGNILYSKSFATLGSSMVNAIGAYYATEKPVVCFIGDQGFQMNSQELLNISQHKLQFFNFFNNTIVFLSNITCIVIPGSSFR